MSTAEKPRKNFKGFTSRIKEATETIKDFDEQILCISHIDADGLTSAGIIGKTLHRAEIPYHIRCVRQLELPIISEISMMKNIKNIIFSDLGGGQLEGINKYLADRNIIILDHHPSIIEPLSNTIIHINPFEFGYDGSNEISGAGISYFFAKEYDKKNFDSSAIAIVGALADRQDKGAKNSLTALNKNIVEDAIKVDVLEEKLDIRLFGRETRPIYQALEYTTDPFLPGLTGNGDMCHRFMRDTGIPQQKGNEWRTIQDLSKEERQMLVESLITYGLSHGMTTEDSQSIIGMVYTLKQEQPGTLLRDAREFGSLLNSCGRLNATGVAIGLCMGERKFLLQEAESIMTNYRMKISKFIEIINQESEHLKEYSNLVVFDGKDLIDDTMIGTVVSIAISTKRFLDKKKPLMGLAKSDDGTIKVSCRGTPELISKGLDLGLALREAVETIGSKAEGGGHNIAAGARIPQGTEKILIESLNIAIDKQLDVENKDNKSNEKKTTSSRIISTKGKTSTKTTKQKND